MYTQADTMQTRKPSLDEGTARRLAVKADCDPRTLKKVLRGEPVRGHVRIRATAALAEAGLLRK